MSRMTFEEGAKRRMLNGDIELVQDERGVGVKYDKLAFRVDDLDSDVPKVVVSMWAGQVLLNELEGPARTLKDGYTLFITDVQGYMYFSNADLVEATK